MKFRTLLENEHLDLAHEILSHHMPFPFRNGVHRGYLSDPSEGKKLTHQADSDLVDAGWVNSDPRSGKIGVIKDTWYVHPKVPGAQIIVSHSYDSSDDTTQHRALVQKDVG